MLKHPYLLSFCILGAVLGAMTYITRHPELWLERAHEAELRAACERMDKALENSVIETARRYPDREKVGNEIIRFIRNDIRREEKNGTRIRRTDWTPGEDDSNPFVSITEERPGGYRRQCIKSGECSTETYFQDIGEIVLPIPYFKRHNTPFQYEILEKMVNVEDRPCVVMRVYDEENFFYYEIFLDPSIGYMPRIEIHGLRKDTPNMNKMNIRVDRYEDYREISENVFLPYQYWYGNGIMNTLIYFKNNSYYFRNDQVKFEEVPIMGYSDYRILSVNLNPVFDEKSFEFDCKNINDATFMDAKSLYQNIGNIDRLFQ